MRLKRLISALPETEHLLLPAVTSTVRREITPGNDHDERKEPGRRTTVGTATGTTSTAAAKVRPGDCLLVDGYYREVVRVETATTPGGPDEPDDDPESDSTGADSAGVRLRICFVNGGSLTIPPAHSVERVTLACRTAP
jgi:hypothetical protein